MNAVLGGTVFRQSIDGWDVSWESSGDYRHWCLQERPGHAERAVIVLKNPGSLRGDGKDLNRDTTLRILRRVGNACRLDWLIVNLFDYAAPQLPDLQANWGKRDRSDAPSLVFARLDFRSYRFVVFAHGDPFPPYASDYLTRVAHVRRSLATLTEIHIPTTKAGYPIHPLNWQRNPLKMSQVIAAIDACR